MTASYRLIQFAPDPFTGARYPLGAVVSHGRGEVSVAKAARVPGAGCLGNRSLAIAAQRLHARLDSIESPDALPAVFGPYVSLSKPRPIPAGVGDPTSWLTSLLTPPSIPGDGLKNVRGSQRSTLGFRFFETWKVARYVEKTFEPTSDWDGWLSPYGLGLQRIAHWVPGEKTALLMEPVVPSRAKFDKDLKEIAAKFLAYRAALDKVENGRTGQLIAYITLGGHPDQRAAAVETLAPFAHSVVDTAQPQRAAAFVEAIRKVGTEGETQEALTQA